MVCESCGEKKHCGCNKDFTKAVIEINNPETLVLLRKVVIPASLPESENPPVIGKYRNVILKYEDTGNIYLYSSDGIPTAIETNIPQEIIDKIDNLEDEDVLLHTEINTVAGNLADEITTRQDADAALGNRITSIEEKIPNQASAQNQLADKNFVNSSVATNTANYISDNGQPFTSLAGLEAYSGPLTNNDYAFVVGTDQAGNTTYTRYKYTASTSSWAEEYVLNNSSFTSDQWTAINSGITSGNVEKLAGLANIKTIGANLTLDSNGELSADAANYAAGDGIDITNDIISATNTGKARILTQADYNWPTNNPDGIALWLLEPGMYAMDGTIKTYFSSVAAQNYLSVVIVGKQRGDIIPLIGIRNVVNAGAGQVKYFALNTRTDLFSEINILDSYDIFNGLTSTSSSKVLSANQGKVLKDLIDSLVVKGTTAPTTSTTGTVGQLYEDTTNGDLYQLKSIDTSVTPNEYNWEQVGGNSVNVVQTTGTSTTDVMSQKATTDMVFLPGVLHNRQSIRIGNTAAASTSGNSIALLGQAGYLSVAIGGTASTSITGAVALGLDSSATADGAVALGRNSTATTRGVVGVGTTNTNYGYNISNYRLITGVYDGQSAHDAATYGQVISYAAINGAGAPTTTTEGKYVGQLYYDTTNEAMYFLKEIDTTTDPDAYTWESLGGGGGIIELTSADYNANSNNWGDGDPANFNCVALWKLRAGVYNLSGLSVGEWEVSMNWNAVAKYPLSLVVIPVTPTAGLGPLPLYLLYRDETAQTSLGELGVVAYVDNNGQYSKRVDINPISVDHLSSTSSIRPLSANQGRVLNGKIGGDLSSLNTTNKTSLINAINELVGRISALGG